MRQRSSRSRVSTAGIALTALWSGAVALLAVLLAWRVFGLRVDHEAEREGLDISAHGESAYER